MRNVCLFSLGLWTIVAGSMFAQELPPPDGEPFRTPPLSPAVEPAQPAQLPPPQRVPEAPRPESYMVVPDAYGSPAVVIAAPPERPHAWAEADLLLWWVKGAPLPVPIAVVTDGGGNSQTVLGNSTTGFGAVSGVRFGLGVWFDEFNNYGVDTSFFSLGENRRRQGVSSDGNGNPSLGLSYSSATPGQPGEYIQNLAVPGSFAGDILTLSTLELWGAEFNGSVCLVRRNGFEFTTLAGFRYVDLQERLFISSASTDLSSGDFFILDDRFATRNEFYGGQFGARVNWSAGRLSLAATGKVGLGATRQLVDIQGSSFVSTNGTYPGGFYAQASNIGRHSATQFGVIPSVELKLSYRFFQSWRLFLGYDFLYWNQVVRPGNQIDRNINLTQSPVLDSGKLSGPSSPSPLFERSDFWAQGMTFGLEFRF